MQTRKTTRRGIVNMQGIIKTFEVAITQKQIELTALKGSLDILRRTQAGNGASPASVNPDQFKGKRIGAAIREYLSIKGSAATTEELLEVLTTGGAKMGKYPKQTVANGVAFGVKNKHLEVKEEVIYLRSA
jgi:hypothetical protein